MSATKKSHRKKLVLVDAFIPEVIAKDADQSARAEASSVPVALKRAVQDILKRNGIRKKHITTMRLSVSVLPAEEREERVL